MVTSRGVGQYVASEPHTFAYARTYRGDAVRRPIIFFPGGIADDRGFLTDPLVGANLTPSLVEVEYPIISAEFDPGADYGSPVTVTRIGEAWTFVKTALGTATDKFIGVGSSQGFTALANYAKDNASNVAAIVGLNPAVDLQDMYDNDRGPGLQAAIGAYYGGRPPDSSNPADNTAALTGIPMQLHYTTDDPAVYPQTVLDFAAATGAELVSMGTGGHDSTNVDTDAVLTFLEQYA